ncbi:MAG: ATP-binding protein [Cyanobacteria bacterium P01_F01_bin.86]
MVALGVTIALAISDFSDRTKTDEILQEQQKLLALKNQLSQAGQGLLLARLDESQLISTYKYTFFESFQYQLRIVESSTKGLLEDCSNQEISELLEVSLINLEKYRKSVTQTVEVQQAMGLEGNEGILSNLRETKEEIQTYLAEINEQALMLEFIQLQLYEKDFSNTLDMGLSDELLKQIADLNSAIQSVDLPQETKILLLREVKKYEKLAAALMSSTLELELTIAESELQYNRIAPKLLMSQEKIDQILEQTSYQLQSQRQVSTIQTIVIFAISFVVLLTFIVLQMQSERELLSRLRKLADGMHEVAIGDFEKIENLPQGKDEIGILAETFLSMAKQIQLQIDTTKKAQEKAEIANQTKSSFLANMTHELRTPLNAILGFTQVIQKQSDLNADQKTNLEIINQSGGHLLSLINDILDMSKVEAGKVVLNSHPFDLYDLLDTLDSMFRLQTESKQIKLVFERDLDTPRFINSDEQKLRQVLLNLVGNALKFTQAGQVKLSVRPGKPNAYLDRLNSPPICAFQRQTSNSFNTDMQVLTFCIEDSGPGIAPDEIERLFEPFSQGKQGQNQEGTGLGLAISRSFIELMGGDIQVSSRLGEGTQFTFSIQVGLIEQTPKRLADSSLDNIIHLAPNQATYRILIVDDNPVIRLLMVRVLTSVGFQVQEAANASEAISCCKQWYPHLIWMDIQMPTVDGYEASRQIKQWMRAEIKSVSTSSVEKPLPQSEQASVETTEPDAIPKSENSDLPPYFSDKISAHRLQNKQEDLPIIIALTSNTVEEDRQVMLAAGCTDFVRKPFNQETVLQKMADYLGVHYLDRNTQSIMNGNTDSILSVALSQKGKFRQISLDFNMLQTMPYNWIKRLHRKACLAEQDAIDQLLQDIPESNTQLALSIRHAVDQFDYEVIVEMTEKILSRETVVRE